MRGLFQNFFVDLKLAKIWLTSPYLRLSWTSSFCPASCIWLLFRDQPVYGRDVDPAKFRLLSWHQPRKQTQTHNLSDPPARLGILLQSLLNDFSIRSASQRMKHYHLAQCRCLKGKYGGINDILQGFTRYRHLEALWPR